MNYAVGLTKNRLALRECSPVVAVFGTFHAHGFDKIRRWSPQRYAVERLRQTRLERDDCRTCVERDLKCLHRLRRVRDLRGTFNHVRHFGSRWVAEPQDFECWTRTVARFSRQTHLNKPSC